MDTKTILRVSDLLQAVANGTIDVKDALESWPCPVDALQGVLATVWHELSHFADDSDIRARDQGYAQYQRDLLFDLARKVRATASDPRAS